ncbi:MAG: hypothetical protein QM676_10395 [Novosphingobium sp.]
MSDRLSPEHKSVHEAAYEHYLRTGERLTNAQWLARQEAKFNPYRAEDGRYDFKPGNGSLTPRERADDANRRVESAKRVLKDWVGFDVDKAARAPRVPPITPPVKNLLEQIAKGEGVSDDDARLHGYASSYDVPFNYGRFARQSKPLTQMTLREIDELQTRILNHPDKKHDSTPVGKYQFVRKTLRELKTKLQLHDDVIFDANLQDRLAMTKLEERGLNKYVDGKISEYEFQKELADEWASIAAPNTGRPAKAGQHLGTTTTQISPLIRALRPTQRER